MTLGGGYEICLAAGRRTAAVESYIGLVEAGAGVIPSGCGCKNLLLAMEAREERLRANQKRYSDSPLDGGPQPKVSAAFELIATARVSISAREAQELGFLAPGDSIVMDREILLHEARREIILWAKTYQPPVSREDISLPGLGGEMALANAIRGFVASGKATEYDAVVARKLAHVLTGGDVLTFHKTSEDHILDLEREAFISLCGEEKTRARMKSLLTTGKPLRN
jgi:3-hydroxyacyl-CoA dehydrogenase